jgi:hypothetical protein
MTTTRRFALGALACVHTLIGIQPASSDFTDEFERIFA